MNYEELMHYGVKGMKWGVRRYQNPDGSLTKAGKKRQQKQAKKYAKKVTRNWVDIHNAAADVNNPKLNELNKKYEGVDFKKDRKAYKQYVKEYVDSWNNDLVSEVKNRFGDAPDIVTTDDILSLLPTAISQENAQYMYESFYEDQN